MVSSDVGVRFDRDFSRRPLTHRDHTPFPVRTTPEARCEVHTQVMYFLWLYDKDPPE